MNIFFVPSGYPSDLYPQSNTFLKEQAIALAKRGHKVIVLNVAQKSYKLLLHTTSSKVEVFRYEGVTEYRKWLYTINGEKYVDYYMKRCEQALTTLFYMVLKREERPDFIYAHFSFYAGFVCGKLARKEGIPLVIQEHYSYLMNEHISKKMQQIEKAAYRASNLFICVSDNLKLKLIKHLHLPPKERGKLIVIENMLSENFTYRQLMNQEGFLFVSVGNLNKRKRFDLLIQGFVRAFSVKDNVQLRIGGAGEECAYLTSLINKYGRKKQILLLGSLTREQVVEECAKAQCFVLVSERETFGIVYREALAVGRPIITSNHGGFERNFNEADGILIEDVTIDSVAAALQNMRNRYDEYDLKAISNRCLSQYSKDVIMEKLEKEVTIMLGE